jgi:hypothetical protein
MSGLFAKLVVGAWSSYSIKHVIHIDQSYTHREISALVREIDEPTTFIFVYEIVILFAAGLATTRYITDVCTGPVEYLNLD